MKHPHSRAHRRHHRARLIEKRVKQRPSWFENMHEQPDGERRLARAQGRLADTSTLCSCVMCGNPRRYFNHRTRAEERADIEIVEGGKWYNQSHDIS